MSFPPAKQVERQHGTARVRLDRLRTDGIARLRTLNDEGLDVVVKSSSWGTDYEAGAVRSLADRVELDLHKERYAPGPSGSPWTLTLSATDPDRLDAGPLPTYWLRVGPPVPPDRFHLPQQGRWLTGESLVGLTWISQVDDLHGPAADAPLSSTRTNPIGARVLRGMVGLDPDSELPAMLDGVIVTVDDDFTEIDGVVLPPVIVLTFSSGVGQPSHQEVVPVGPITVAGGPYTYQDPHATHPHAPLADAHAARQLARDGYGLDVDDRDQLIQTVAVGLTNILWRNTELEDIHAGVGLPDDPDDRDGDARHARREQLRADTGWARPDQFGIDDTDMMRATTSVTAAIRQLLASSWDGYGTPLPLDALDTLDPTVQLGDVAMPASTWLGTRWDDYRADRHRKTVRLARFARTWSDHGLALLAAAHATVAVPFFHGLPWHDELLDTVLADDPQLHAAVERMRQTPWALTDAQAWQLRWPTHEHARDVHARWADRHGRTHTPTAGAGLDWVWGSPI